MTIRLDNGFEIPQIGVGTWTLLGETARQNVSLALEAGFRHIDTAQAYDNEAEVGQGIVDSSVTRHDIFLTTKVATNIMREGREAVGRSIDESLYKLKTDYIEPATHPLAREGLREGYMAGDGRICEKRKGTFHRREQFQPPSFGRIALLRNNSPRHQSD